MTGDSVDALVAGVAPDVRPPAVRRRDVVLVVGPWLAGSSSVLAALQDRLADIAFVESADLCDGEAPTAVVFVVSAVAPLTESDCAVLDAAAAHTDLVVAAVSKIDLHRQWREIRDEDHRLLTAHAPRYAGVPWVGVAAAPDLGDVDVDALAEALGTRRADDGVSRRNHLRSWEFQLVAELRRYEKAADSVGRAARVTELGETRTEMARRHRVEKTERAVTLRSQMQQARVQLAYYARSRCASVRSELHEDVSVMTRRAMANFPAHVGGRVTDVVHEVDEGITAHLADVANLVGLEAVSVSGRPGSVEPVGEPPLKSRRVETRLMMLLGAGFGLGVALTLSRIFADLAPGLTAAGAAVCVAVGLAVTVWVVGMRGLLHDRAVLDRWVSDVTAALRATVDQSVATRVLAAETTLTVSLAEQEEARSAVLTRELTAIDTELREHASAKARAAAASADRTPVLQRALDVVRAELCAADECPNPGGGPMLEHRR